MENLGAEVTGQTRTDRSKEATWRFRGIKDMTVQKYNSIMLEQDNKCACCGIQFDTLANSNRVHLDHDHRTGGVRGILCHSCNVGIGHLGDNLTGLINALDYLLRTTHGKG